jgi:hypothetical protein
MSQKSKVEIVSVKLADVKLDTTKIHSISIHTSIEMIGAELNLMFDDISDLKNNIPLHGGELITIVFKDIKSKTITKKFILTSLKEIVPNVSVHSVTNIIGISEEAFKLLTERTNKCCVKSPTSIIKKIAPKVKILSNSKDAITAISPGWTKNKFIQYLCNHAVDGKGNAGYLFYEDIEDMKVSTLHDLLSKPVSKTYKINTKNPNYQYNILDYQQIKKQKLETDITYTNSKTKVMMYNPDKKKVCSKVFDVDKLNTKRLGSVKDDKKEKEYAPTKLQVVGWQYKDVLKTRGNDILFSSFKKTYKILINGLFDVKVGDLIKVDFIDKFTGDKSAEFSGKWIITKASYHLTNNTFMMKCEIQKNASEHEVRY